MVAVHLKLGAPRWRRGAPQTISLSRRGRVFQLNQFQFDRFCITALQVYRGTLFFGIFQEVWILPGRQLAGLFLWERAWYLPVRENLFRMQTQFVVR